MLTIRRVYNELETEGYLNSRMGKGTFVAMANSELIMESKRHMIETKLQQVVVEAKTFDIPKREIIEIIELLFEEDLKREYHY